MHTVLGSRSSDPSFAPEQPSSESLGLLTATVDEEIERSSSTCPTTTPTSTPIRGRGEEVRERLASADEHRRRRAGDPPPRRLPPRPDAVGGRRLGDPRLRGRAGALAPRAAAEAQPAARRRRACCARSPTRRRRRSSCAASSRRTAGRSGRAPSSSPATARRSTRRSSRRARALEKLLAVFELEKAVYELRYELNNRPDWIGIPVAGIVRMLDEEARRVTQARASAFGELDIWLARRRAGTSELYEKLGAHSGRRGRRASRSGRRTRGRSASSATSTTGTRPRDLLAAGRRDRHLGGRRRRRRGRASATSTTSTAARRPTRSRSRPRCRRRPRRSSSSRRTTGSDADWIDERRVARAARAPDLDLRGARAVVARTASAGASSPTQLATVRAATSASRTSS